MHERFEKRIEEGLGKIQTSCLKRNRSGWTIATRVAAGRAWGEHAKRPALFDVKVETDGGGFARLRWSKLGSPGREWAPVE